MTDDYDTTKTLDIYKSTEDGTVYVGEVYEHEYEFVKSNLYSKQGSEFVRIYKLDSRDSGYTLNGDHYTEDEFYKMFEGNIFQIGEEDTEIIIADNKRVISHLDD